MTRHSQIRFDDYPEFRPNITPKQMFHMGSFGGTYWRPIQSKVTQRSYSNMHKKYPKDWWVGIKETEYLTRDWSDYNKHVNKYKVKVGTTLEFWEEKEWIYKQHPYGWVQWYCNFYQGIRSPDDARQVKRWVQTAGPKSRFRRALINEIKRKGVGYDDFTISPKRRQTLQHWGYILTKSDMK